jgi:hypothetical protein
LQKNFAPNASHTTLVSKIGIVNVGAMPDLEAAKAQIKSLAVNEPGEYVVYRRNDGRVIAKAERGVSQINVWASKGNPPLQLERSLSDSLRYQG